MNRPAGLSRRKIVYALILIVGGFAGLLAAFSLTLDALAIAKDPTASLTCNVNSTLQCAANIGSWQGHVFGPPNPLLGLMMFPAPIVVGFALLAGARFRAWFWWIFTAGMWFAAIFVMWLAFESIFTIRTLCPWCALTYVAVIPMWAATNMALLRSGAAGEGGKTLAQRLGAFPPITLAVVVLLLIFGIAQLRLGILQTLIG